MGQDRGSKPKKDPLQPSSYIMKLWLNDTKYYTPIEKSYKLLIYIVILRAWFSVIGLLFNNSAKSAGL